MWVLNFVNQLISSDCLPIEFQLGFVIGSHNWSNHDWLVFTERKAVDPMGLNFIPIDTVDKVSTYDLNLTGL